MWIRDQEYIYFLTQSLEACREVTIIDSFQISKPRPGEVRHVQSVLRLVSSGART